MIRYRKWQNTQQPLTHSLLHVTNLQLHSPKHHKEQCGSHIWGYFLIPLCQELYRGSCFSEWYFYRVSASFLHQKLWRSELFHLRCCDSARNTTLLLPSAQKHANRFFKTNIKEGCILPNIDFIFNLKISTILSHNFYRILLIFYKYWTWPNGLNWKFKSVQNVEQLIPCELFC